MSDTADTHSSRDAAAAAALASENEGRAHWKPRLRELRRALRIDVSYERGAGDYLYYRDESGREIEVLDVVGGYGSLLLGHAHPKLVAEAQRLLASGRPMHAQGSRGEFAARLARELSQRCGGDYCAVFGNSGAEAIEAAMKHAMRETGGRTFIALERGFHGKTLGALQLTANPSHREPFDLTGLNVVRVPANDIARLEAAFASAADLAGFVFEPVQGEGGVRPLDAAFAQRAAALCAEHDVPLIADECQTGLGRTGTFLACAHLGVQPDYIVLSKALGGGLAKISALLIRRERYDDEFDLQHTSTYAEDDFSCALALRTLALVDDAVLAACRDKGRMLLDGLRAIATEFSESVAEARGVGLMLALEFRRLNHSTSFLLRFISAQEDLGFVATGYLLNAHRIRIAPTLSERFTLRIEPSALIGEREIDRLLAALRDLCGHLARGDALALTRSLVGPAAGRAEQSALVRTDARFAAFDEVRFQASRRRATGRKVAWLCHLVDADDLVSLEPAFAELSFAERERYLAQLVSRIAPVAMSSVEVRSTAGSIVQFHPILLPVTSAWIKQRMDARAWTQPQAIVQQGVDLAQALGCELVSLGQYTSIVTRNGTRLASRGLGLTTGNSYAIALAVQAIERAERAMCRKAAEAVLVVVGAAGNIGETCAAVLAPRYRRTILVGSSRPGSLARLQALAARLPNASVATDLACVGEGDVVVAATNAIDAPLSADRFARNAIVCDLSVPASVAADVESVRPDVTAIKGGIAALPFGEDLELVDFPLPAGRVYGCMAEAMLLGFEGVRDATFTGALTSDHVARVAAMAMRHGFALADYRTSCVLGSERGDSDYAIAR